MTAPRFLQIHTLSPYTGALLNRDDAGLAKRLPYGGMLRTRVSSQCLKRHWAKTDDPHALIRIDGVEAAYRSRELVTRTVIDPLRGRFPEDVVNALEPEIQQAVYGDKGTTKASRQTLLFGAPEIAWLAKEAERLAQLKPTAMHCMRPRRRQRIGRRTIRANIKHHARERDAPLGNHGRVVRPDGDL